MTSHPGTVPSDAARAATGRAHRCKVGLHLISTGEEGGTYQYALSLLHALAKLPADRYEVYGLCAIPEWEERCASLGVPALDVPPYSLTARIVARLLRVLPRGAFTRKVNSAVVPFGRMLKREGFDVCVYPRFEQYAYELATPSIGAIHDLMHRMEPEFPEVSEGDIPVRRDRIFSSIYRGSTVTVVDSEIGKQHVVDAYGGTGESIEVLPYPVPDYILESHADCEKDFGDVFGRLPDKYLFYPAQFWSHKNHVRLVQAVARVKRQSPDVHLVLAGSPKNGYEAAVAAIAAAGLEQSVTILGYVPDEVMPCLYRRARALVYACIFGPTGIPPIEAQALGCPVAAPRIYAMPEQLGDGAVYFDPRSVDEMAEVIDRLWNDDALCADLADKGLRNVERYLPEQFARRLAHVIDVAAAGSKR